ncbi:pentapeptide repeat-containing protein [Psychrobacter sp. M13]|uniref:pentapeptide repeat-containing protein n=1 Tax=Psychrobacter sp. M13 TaxID=3067275 RepID=UPI00273B51A0|nr:pentapeptide repeat-containing protein [Psychrobacter sp. M13]WLP95161.1 pentapeptide repeat-containing protein [Psychrobacter sp. M13]
MSEIIISKPVSVLNRNVKFDLKDFFVQASKTAVQATAQGVTGNVIGSAATIVKGLFDISKTTELELKVEELAWLLLVRSLTHAISEILNSNQDLFSSEFSEEAIENIATKIEAKINESEVIIDNEFFNAPRSLALLDELAFVLIEWLQQLGLDKYQARATYSRLKSQFAFSLDKEWATNTSQYILIIDQLSTPFTKATATQRSIMQYRSWLQQQVNERMFDEAFGLKQIYVPLRAYYMEPKEQDENAIAQNLIEPIDISTTRSMNKIVCDLENEIQKWLSEYNEHDTLRVISGGPGSGKSSFAKILAANLSAQSDIPILFIPLHHFYLSDYLLEAIKKFIDNQLILSQTDMTEEKNLLLIFDGLDELSMQSGANVTEASNRFITEVQDALRDRKNVRWKAIITGRELSIQSQQHKLKKPKTVYYLLPYYIDEEKREGFSDSNGLLMNDQRSEWWQKLAKLKGLKFNDLPKELATKHLEPITTEPLLNYLVSLSYLKEGGIVFSEDTNLNEIYADLLNSVHERKYTDSGIHKSVDSINKKKFIRILQEIALTVWHENGRTASVSQITEQCKKANIDSYFKEFTKDAESGVIRLLMAFYFRKFDGNNSDETFEFTHKSFGEYLTAKRIMLELSKMLHEVERFKEEADSGWTLEYAFEKWIRVCGPQRIDTYLSEFLAGEIQILASSRSGLSIINQYQKLLIELIQMAANGQSPIKKLGLNDFSDDMKFSQNSEVALLELHSLFAIKTGKTIKDVGKEYRENFDTWLKRLDYRIRAKLNHLDLSQCNIHGSFLNCDFRSSILDDSQILFSNFFDSDFRNASFKNAVLYETGFDKVIFDETILINTRFISISFKGSRIEEVDLSKAVIRGCNFTQVNAKKAKFNSLKSVDDDFVNFSKNNFNKANLEYAEFKNTDFRNVDFSHANITGTNFTDANLENANFEGTNYEKAIFTGANLKGTILENIYPSTEEETDE